MQERDRCRHRAAAPTTRSNIMPSLIFLILTLFSAMPVWGASPVVLLTHPTRQTLKYYEVLNACGLLGELVVTGIYHIDETEDYVDAARYLAEDPNRSWIRLQPVSCGLTSGPPSPSDDCYATFAALIAHSDGLIVSGGPDLPPELYQAYPAIETSATTPERSHFEVALLKHLLGSSSQASARPLLTQRPSYFVMGICGGMQAMNVAAGGTLHQHIPDTPVINSKIADTLKVESQMHCYPPPPGASNAPSAKQGVMHAIELTEAAPACLRAAIAAVETPRVLSVHHQAVAHLANDYIITAQSPWDHVVEGIRHRVFTNVWGWQFHPEQPILWAGAPASQSPGVLPDDTALGRAVWQLMGQALRESARG